MEQEQNLTAIDKRGRYNKDGSDGILDVREYDVPYYVRVAIDNGKFKF